MVLWCGGRVHVRAWCGGWVVCVGKKRKEKPKGRVTYTMLTFKKSAETSKKTGPLKYYIKQINIIS